MVITLQVPETLAMLLRYARPQEGAMSCYLFLQRNQTGIQKTILDKQTKQTTNNIHDDDLDAINYKIPI